MPMAHVFSKRHRKISIFIQPTTGWRQCQRWRTISLSCCRTWTRVSCMKAYREHAIQNSWRWTGLRSISCLTMLLVIEKTKAKAASWWRRWITSSRWPHKWLGRLYSGFSRRTGTRTSRWEASTTDSSTSHSKTPKTRPPSQALSHSFTPKSSPSSICATTTSELSSNSMAKSLTWLPKAPKNKFRKAATELYVK